MNAEARARVVVRSATTADRDAIYRIRHDVYARELGQHHANDAGRLTDALDAYNTYYVAERTAQDGSDAEIIGFISLTPPGTPSYSIDKYFKRDEIPVVFDSGLFEIRILTVVEEHRRGPAAMMLMDAALEHVAGAGGRFIVIIGRREVARLYERVGLRRLGPSTRSGALTYDLMGGTVDEVRAATRRDKPFASRLAEAKPRAGAGAPPAVCDHGGAFYRAIGTDFSRLDQRSEVVNADVLDAWFPPAPGVIDALSRDLAWVLRTSPPTHAEGLIDAIAAVRGVAPECIVPGAGSSDLIFRALQRWLTPSSRALILDPMYGEYAHVLQSVIGCRVDRLHLRRENGYALDLGELASRLAAGYDLVVLVNPNNPTGRHVEREDLLGAIGRAPAGTRLWIDETYIDYAGPGQSLEHHAAVSANTVVCKSMSKVYALSGARAAYLCAPPAIAADLRRLTPPWPVSLPAQMAAIEALADPAYYERRRAETHALRAMLSTELRGIGIDVLEGVINSVLGHLPEGSPDAPEIVRACASRGVYIRDCATISRSFGARAIRVAVRDRGEACRVVEALTVAVRGSFDPAASDPRASVGAA